MCQGCVGYVNRLTEWEKFHFSLVYENNIKILSKLIALPNETKRKKIKPLTGESKFVGLSLERFSNATHIHLLFVKMEFVTYGTIRFFNSKSVSKYKEKKKSYLQNFLIYPVKTL